MALQATLLISDQIDKMDFITEIDDSSRENDSVKDKFNRDLQKFYSAQSGKVKKPWTKDRVAQVISHVKASKEAVNFGIRRSSEQYYWSTKYDVINIGNEDHLILKKKNPGGVSTRVIPVEQYFDVLYEVHEEIGHGARDKMQYHLKNKFYIQIKAIEIFISLCPVCEIKRKKGRRLLSLGISVSDKEDNEYEIDAAHKTSTKTAIQKKNIEEDKCVNSEVAGIVTKGNKKILEEIHPLNIITEVEKWPILYTKDSPEQTNLHFKTKIWKEIARALFKDWESLKEAEKNSKTLGLIKRWRNLRDTFKRQLVIEKKNREGCSIKKKTYVYFKYMLFLLPHIDTPDTAEEDRMIEPRLDEYFNRQNKRKLMKDKISRSKRKKTLSPIESPKDETEIDEDKHFLMSLIPSFKKMSDNEKLTAKVEILKVIKDIRHQPSTSACNIIEDVLSYNPRDDDHGEVKIEMFHSELEQESINDSDESDDSSD